MEQMEKPEYTPEEQDYRRRRKIVSIVSIVLVAVLFVAITIVVGRPLISYMGEPERFKAWVASHGAWGPLALIGIQILQVVISIIPGEVVEIGAGYAFGAVPGALLCLAGAAAGSAMIFWLTKKFGIRLVEAFISREQINSLGFIKNAHKLNLLVFILYFIPGTPKDILTYFIGLTPMKLTTFLLLTTIARIPSVISSTIGGHALGSREYLMAVIVFVVTGIVSAIGILVYRRIEKRKAPEIQDK